MSKVELHFALTGVGWVAGGLRVGGLEARFSASYLSDAFGNLVAATLNLLHGSVRQLFSFDEEPGEYRWVLERSQSQLHLRLLSFDQLWGGQPDDQGALLVDVAVDLNAWALAVKQCCDTLLEEHGLDGYHDLWVDACFPVADYRKLCECLALPPHEAVNKKTRKRKLRRT